MRTSPCSCDRSTSAAGAWATGWRSSRWRVATASPTARPGELTFRRYRRFGAGGAKLIWGEAAAVVPEGRANPRQLVIHEATAPALERLLRRTRAAHVEATGHDDDLLVGLQLTHSGRYSFPRPILAQHDPLLDPRTIVDKATGRIVGPG